MKRLILTLVCSAIIATALFAQSNINSASPTTEEEYNYVVRGYQVQLSSGLDMKKGYLIQDLTKSTIDGFDFDFKILAREEKEEIAAIMVIIYSRTTKNTYYVCIPHQNQALTNRYFAFMDQWNEKMTKAYGKASSSLVSAIFMLYIEAEKKSK